MKQHERVETFNMEDGRKAERHIYRNPHGERVTEIFAEEKKPLKLSKRVVEKEKPVVCERRIETIAEGQITDVRYESCEPDVRMELKQHIGLVSPAEAQSFVTRDDLKSIFTSVVETMAKNQMPPQPSSFGMTSGTKIAMVTSGVLVMVAGVIYLLL